MQHSVLSNALTGEAENDCSGYIPLLKYSMHYHGNAFKIAILNAESGYHSEDSCIWMTKTKKFRLECCGDCSSYAED